MSALTRVLARQMNADPREDILVNCVCSLNFFPLLTIRNVWYKRPGNRMHPQRKFLGCVDFYTYHPLLLAYQHTHTHKKSRENN